MKLSIMSGAYTLNSELTVEDIVLLKKYNPDALTIKDEDGNVKFAVGYSEGKPSIAPFRVSSMSLYMRTTHNNVYIGAIAEFADDAEYAVFEKYTTDSGIEFDVVLDDNEKIQLLTSLVNYLSV